MVTTFALLLHLVPPAVAPEITIVAKIYKQEQRLKLLNLRSDLMTYIVGVVRETGSKPTVTNRIR